MVRRRVVRTLVVLALSLASVPVLAYGQWAPYFGASLGGSWVIDAEVSGDIHFAGGVSGSSFLAEDRALFVGALHAGMRGERIGVEVGTIFESPLAASSRIDVVAGGRSGTLRADSEVRSRALYLAMTADIGYFVVQPYVKVGVAHWRSDTESRLHFDGEFRGVDRAHRASYSLLGALGLRYRPPRSALELRAEVVALPTTLGGTADRRVFFLAGLSFVF